MPYIIGSGVSPNKSFTDIPETRTASLNMSDNELISPKLKDWSEVRNIVSSSSGAIVLDMSQGNVFYTQLTENITSVTISNAPSSTSVGTLTWIVTQDSTARTINFPANKVWASKLVPTISTIGATYIFNLKTTDGGSSWIISSEGGVGTPPPNAPSSLTLSLPSQFVINVSAQLDVTVGNDGGDSNLSYAWQISLDNGSNWITTGLSNSNIKNPTMTFTSTYAAVKARVTVSNGGGATISTSSSLAVVATVIDSDSEFLDTSTHTLSGLNAEYTVPQVSQQGGQNPFQQMDLEVQWTRNKFNVTTSGSDVVINHGPDNIQPFNISDKVVVSGTTDVVTTISNISRGSVAGTNTILLGSETEISGTSTTIGDYSISTIDNTRILCSYMLSSGGYTGYVIVGTVSGTVISWGSPVMIASGGQYINAEYIGNNKGVISYVRWDGPSGRNVIDLRVGGISGNSISIAGVAATIASDITLITPIGIDKFVVFLEGSGTFSTKIGTISDYSISLGSENSVIGSTRYGTGSIYLGNSKIIHYSYNDYPTRIYKYSIGTISGNSISWPAIQEIASNCSYLKVHQLSSDTIVVLYAEGGSAYAKLGVISGSNISFQSPVLTTATSGDIYSSCVIDSNRILMTHSSVGIIGTITGLTFTWGTSFSIFSGILAWFSKLSVISSNKIAMHYGKNSSKYGAILTYDGTNYTSTITPALLPTSPATIELLPIQLQGDLDSGTPTYQDLSETYSVVNSTTAKCVATLTDSGMKADIKLISTNSDFNNLIISRINATFRN